ncbi:unnamed protein product [Soboliphyme baturini]|uniref:Endo/exonuclease/phosphatase domain-containing protein n=1 Tax=Soboliphyme baturini TaxID=241478 RepID=A0A183J571_9BILA|nr:unnamed protein product [Soboliphyme baturini]
MVRLSSTKREGSGILNFRWWKPFYSGVDGTPLSQLDVGILVEPNLVGRIIDWKPVSGRVTFLEEVQCALSEVPNTQSLILTGDFNAQVGVDVEKCNGVIGKNGSSDVNNNGMELLRFRANNGLSIMNTFFEQRRAQQYSWHRGACAHKSMIDLVIASSN